MQEKALDECAYPHEYFTPGQREEPESLPITLQCILHLERAGDPASHHHLPCSKNTYVSAEDGLYASLQAGYFLEMQDTPSEDVMIHPRRWQGLWIIFWWDPATTRGVLTAGWQAALFRNWWPWQNRACQQPWRLCWASLLAQMVKNLPAMRETQVRSLGREDPLEKGMATHSSILGLPFWLG